MTYLHPTPLSSPMTAFQLEQREETGPIFQYIYSHIFLFLLIVLSLSHIPSVASAKQIIGSEGSTLWSKKYAEFNEPWAMTFLPKGDMLVTEKSGTLLLITADGTSKVPVKGIPKVAYGGQGGLGDVILHPQFSSNKLVYFSYAEQDRLGKKGAVVARAQLSLDFDDPRLHNIEIIWRQRPKVKGSGHYSHRLAFNSEGKLFITSGERQKQKPAQDGSQNLGKVLRLNADGSVPVDNPFQDKGKLAKTFWSLGHRNLLGIAFDQTGRLWTHEMGPRHGDEFNLTVAGDNYGWPVVSWGNHYSGLDIADHDTRPEFHPPEVYWVPTIAPSGLIIYNGTMFKNWYGNAIIGGLASKSLIRVKISGDTAREIERFAMGKRIREVEQGPDGAIWVLEDKQGGRLLKLTPQKQ